MRRSAALLTLMLASIRVHADVGTNLEGCRSLSDPDRRLACYDAIDTAPGVGTGYIAGSATDRAAGLSATLLDDLSGWEPGTEFRLDNGQTWKYSGKESMRMPTARHASVTIRKGPGGYWLTVDSNDRSAPVRLVQQQH